MTQDEQERCTREVAEAVARWAAANPGHPPVQFRVYETPADEHGPAEDVIEFRFARRYIEVLEVAAWRAGAFGDLLAETLNRGMARARDGLKAIRPGVQELHVQMTPTVLFCGETRGAAIRAEAWQREPEQVQKATCLECLRRIFMLGDSAKIKLARMGLKVDVHDVDESALTEN